MLTHFNDGSEDIEGPMWWVFRVPIWISGKK
jgi:hypothetical protein